MAQVLKSIDAEHPESNTCRILALPAELRNEIYRYAIIEDGQIEVTLEGPGEPELLRTCGEIRQEAITIYYTENHFVLQIEDWDGAPLLPFMPHYKRNVTGCPPNIGFDLEVPPNWDNMVLTVYRYLYGFEADLNMLGELDAIMGSWGWLTTEYESTS